MVAEIKVNRPEGMLVTEPSYDKKTQEQSPRSQSSRCAAAELDLTYDESIEQKVE